MRARDASIGLALVLMVLLLSSIMSVGTEQVAAQSSGGTGIDASQTSTGFFERRIEYNWDLQKSTGQTQVDIWAGNCSTINYTLNATRNLASQTDRYGVRGQTCVTNTGAISTQNLTIIMKVQYKTGSGQFQDLPGATVTILPSQLNAGQQTCYPYEIVYTPISGAIYRTSAEVTITNHSGHLVGSKNCPGPNLCPFGPNPKVDFTLPSQPTIIYIDAESDINDTPTVPTGFTCTPVNTGYGTGPFHLTDTGSINLGLQICNTQADCGTIYQLINNAKLKTKDTGREKTSSATTQITTNPCSAGCTLTLGFWKTHAGFTGNNPDLVSALLPVSLGTSGGAKSVQVTTAQQAVFLLGMSGDASNGINKLYAQLLAAKFNIISGASSSAITGTLSSADAFLATNNSADWSSLTSTQKQMILNWASTLDSYNNGLIGPGHCQ